MTDNIHAIVLAAGASTRFGGSKQLADLGGSPLVAAALGSAGEVCGADVTLVLGHDWQPIVASGVARDCFLVINDRYTEGLGSSIAVAVRAIRHAARAILVVLGDQPRVPSQHFAALVRRWSGDRREIVATAYAGTVGVPALFPPGAFDALAALGGDRGAKSLFSDSRFTLKTVACEEAAIDIDRPEDLDRLR